MSFLKCIIAILFMLLVGQVGESHALNKVWGAICLEGTDCLNAIDGSSLTDGDLALVGRDNGGRYEGYLYRVEDTAGASADSPNVIIPTTNPGNKSWRLLEFFAKAISISDVLNDNYVKITNNAGGRAPTASSYEIYPDAGLWKMNTNGTESTMVHSVTKPTSGTACSVGQISADADYFYFCNGTTWNRVAHTDWP